MNEWMVYLTRLSLTALMGIAVVIAVCVYAVGWLLVQGYDWINSQLVKPEAPLQELYYSESEEILFWVAGYTADNQTENVCKQTESLKANARRFARVANCPLSVIRTRTITQSRRYKHMRVFWVDYADPVPGAFVFKDTWTMENWLEF